MLLVQRINDDAASGFTLLVVGRVYPNMKALEKDMKTNPENFNEGMEYSLIEPRKFAKVTWEKKAIVETANLPLK